MEEVKTDELMLQKLTTIPKEREAKKSYSLVFVMHDVRLHYTA